MVSISQLTKRYGSHVVLNGISLQLEQRRVYGIMGENGAGKSTLFRCIAGLERHEGTVALAPGTRIGYLPDVPYFYPMVTGREFIRFCLDASCISCTDADIEAKNELFLLPLDKFPSKYSLGMRKRLMLLVLMLQECDFYILDEPFSGLDLMGTLLLKRWIGECRQQGRTVLLSSHIVSSLTDLCDELSHIHHGQIVRTFHHGEATPTEIETYLENLLNHAQP